MPVTDRPPSGGPKTMDEGSKESSGEGQSQEPEAAKLGDEKCSGETPTEETSAAATPDGTPVEATPAEAVASAEDPPAHPKGAAGESALPVVWSPKLGGDEISTEEILHSARPEDMHMSGEGPGDEAAASDSAERPPMPRSLRFALVAVSFAAAAAVGSFIGSL